MAIRVSHMSAPDAEALFQMIARWRSAVGPDPNSGLEIVKTKIPPEQAPAVQRCPLLRRLVGVSGNVANGRVVRANARFDARERRTYSWKTRGAT
jgi:hypothetical protein